eukprot:8887036-Alexandrium_andersonii.AAC.1
MALNGPTGESGRLGVSACAASAGRAPATRRDARAVAAQQGRADGSARLGVERLLPLRRRPPGSPGRPGLTDADLSQNPGLQRGAEI